jgi:hypothetical protein
VPTGDARVVRQSDGVPIRIAADAQLLLKHWPLVVSREHGAFDQAQFTAWGPRPGLREVGRKNACLFAGLSGGEPRLC